MCRSLPMKYQNLEGRDSGFLLKPMPLFRRTQKTRVQVRACDGKTIFDHLHLYKMSIVMISLVVRSIDGQSFEKLSYIRAPEHLKELKMALALDFSEWNSTYVLCCLLDMGLINTPFLLTGSIFQRIQSKQPFENQGQHRSCYVQSNEGYHISVRQPRYPLPKL